MQFNCAACVFLRTRQTLVLQLLPLPTSPHHRKAPRIHPRWTHHSQERTVGAQSEGLIYGSSPYGDGRSATHVCHTSHLIVNGYERQLVRRTRSAARQGCCALGRGAARRFDWADSGQDDNKRASCKHPRYSHGPAAAWESLAKPWVSLQPVFPSDAYTARGRAPLCTPVWLDERLGLCVLELA